MLARMGVIYRCCDIHIVGAGACNSPFHNHDKGKMGCLKYHKFVEVGRWMSKVLEIHRGGEDGMSKASQIHQWWEAGTLQAPSPTEKQKIQSMLARMGVIYRCCDIHIVGAGACNSPSPPRTGDVLQQPTSPHIGDVLQQPVPRPLQRKMGCLKYHKFVEVGRWDVASTVPYIKTKNPIHAYKNG